MDAQRALLDELMGTARNLTEEEKKGHKELKWDDPDVCGPYMVRFCPHDLFVNTRSNLGPCSRIHDLKLKERRQKRRQKRKRGLQGSRKQRSVGNRGAKSTIVGAGIEMPLPEGRDLGSVTMTVIVSMSEAVEETGPMITEREDQITEAIPTEMGGILKEAATNDRGRMRSRSRSPTRHGYGRSRSPDR